MGSSFSAWRCSTIRIWRCSRTACCAAAMVAGRPSVIGKTISGNSTVLRTGTTMKASDGSDWIGWPGVPGLTPIDVGGGLMARSSAAAPWAAGSPGSRWRRRCAASRNGPAGSGMWRSKRPCGSSRRWMVAVRSSCGSTRSPAIDSPLLWITISTLSGSTPGSATRTRTASWVSSTSVGGSQLMPRRDDCGGLKTSRCSRSARASICSASDHIQLRGSSLAIGPI